MPNNSRAAAAGSTSRISQISSSDPRKASQYYREAMREAMDIVKSADAQRKSAQR
jgi:hypothetical protein